VDESSFGELFQFLDQHRRPDNIIELTQKQVVAEESFLKNKKYGLDHVISVLPATSQGVQMYSGDSKFQLSRIMLSHLGFLSLDHKDKMYVIV
jgi:hypothetical protein